MGRLPPDFHIFPVVIELIEKIRIQNFRCLKSVEVPLTPFTVLIGPNNTGKSAFLSAIAKFADPALRQFAAGLNASCAAEVPLDMPSSDFWNNDTAHSPSFSATSADSEVILSCQEPPGAKCWEIQGDLNDILPMSFFSTSRLTLDMTSPGADENAARTITVGDRAENVPAILDIWLRKDRKRFFRVVETLKTLIPGLEDLNIETPEPQTRRCVLVLENDLVLDANNASFGVKLLIFFVVLANQPWPPHTILVDEPEIGVHPKRLADIVTLLRGLTTGAFADYATQVIVSTHSPYLLDCIELANADESVLVFQRQTDGSRSATPVNSDRLKWFLDEFMLGEIWMNEEEAGLVKKES